MKQKELIECIHYYFNEEGNLVFTRQYHLEKGFCRGLGCLHCPYYKNVPEPRHTDLIATNTKKEKS